MAGGLFGWGGCGGRLVTVPWGLVQEVYLGMVGVGVWWTGRMGVEVLGVAVTWEGVRE